MTSTGNERGAPDLLRSASLIVARLTSGRGSRPRGAVTAGVVEDLAGPFGIDAGVAGVDRHEHSAGVDPLLVIARVVVADPVFGEVAAEAAGGGAERGSDGGAFRDRGSRDRARGGEGTDPRDGERRDSERRSDRSAAQQALYEAALVSAAIVRRVAAAVGGRVPAVLLVDDGQGAVADSGAAQLGDGALGFGMAVKDGGYKVLAHEITPGYRFGGSRPPAPQQGRIGAVPRLVPTGGRSPLCGSARASNQAEIGLVWTGAAPPLPRTERRR